MLRLSKNIFKMSFDSLALVGLPRKASMDVLIVRLDAIGDFVLWLESATELIKYYKNKNKKVILVANSSWSSWAKELEIFDEVIPLNISKFGKNLLYRFSFLIKIKRISFEISIHPTYSRTLEGDSVVRLSRAPIRIGYDGDCSNIDPEIKKITNYWYNKLIYSNNSIDFEILRNSYFVSKLTGEKKPARVTNLRPLLKDSIMLRELLAPIENKEFYILFPGASWSGRQWSMAGFALLSEKIYKETGMMGVVCGGPLDVLLSKALEKSSNAPLLNLTGSTSLGELSTIISKSKFVITNETSAVHIAAAVGVKAFCILGGGHFARFSPYPTNILHNQHLPTFIYKKLSCFHCNWTCVFEIKSGDSAPCIEQITFEDVWGEVKFYISKSDSLKT